jgi:Fur family peroxide stress response transcriptional regulator
MDKTTLVKLLKDKDVQVTPQRLAIFERLVDHKDHPSAEMIYSDLTRDFPSLTLVTVYNTLQKLESTGLCCKVNPLHSSARYDGNPTAHIHLICSSCEKVLDLHNVPFSVDVPHGVADEFEVRSHNVTVFGLCRRCQTGDAAGSGDWKSRIVPSA